MFKSNRILSVSIKIDPIPDIEESIYYTIHSKFYLQRGFPENSQLYGNVKIYQLILRLDYNEIWISNLGAQTHPPGQKLTPFNILQRPFINIPPHGPGSGA